MQNREIILDYERGNVSAAMALNAFRFGKMTHAYLLTGARGLGKRTLAKALACTLYCTAEEKPCFHCAACRQVLEGNNPDVLTLFSDDDKPIRIEQVREVISAVSRHSFSAGYRAVLIEPAEKMTPAAQNALLKSLEEPLSDVVYLLMTHEVSATLGTIASRCSRVKLLPRPDETLSDTLVKLGFPEDRVRSVLPLCSGSIGLALSLLEENGETEAQRFAKAALSLRTDADAVGLSTKMKENREVAEECLRCLEDMVHRAIRVRTGCMEGTMITDLPPLWRQAAETAPVPEMNAVLDAVFATRMRSAAQLNWQSNLDHLLMVILEENQKWQKLLA